MALQRNRILIDAAALTLDDDAVRINLLHILSRFSAVDKTASLPVVPLHFDKDVLFDFILRALAKQHENGIHFRILKDLSDLDEKISKFGSDLADRDKLALQLLVHFSKIASDESYNAGERLQSDISVICYDLLLPHNKAPDLSFARRSPSSSETIFKFLTRPIILQIFYDQLVRYKFTDLSLGKLKLLVDEMVIYETGQCRWSVAGWAVMDGIVIMRGGLRHSATSHRAMLYTIVLRETLHYLAQCFSKNFAFSSLGKFNEFKDPDEKPASEGKGLELARRMEVELLGVEVDWRKTPPDVAGQFIKEFEDDNHSGPYLANARDRLVPQKFPLSASGMFIDFYWYYHERFRCCSGCIGPDDRIHRNYETLPE